MLKSMHIKRFLHKPNIILQTKNSIRSKPKMQKIIYFILLFYSFLFADRSIYPLPITFNDESFVPASIYPDKNNDSFFELYLVNHNDDALFYKKKIDMFHCKSKMSYKEFLNMGKNTKCYKSINTFRPKLDQIITLNEFKILVYSNSVKEIEAYVFKNNKFTAKMGYIGNKKSVFYDTLKSIKTNHNIKPIDFYVKKGLENVASLKLNTALKYTYSALLINLKDRKIAPIIMQIDKMTNVKLEILKNVNKI